MQKQIINILPFVNFFGLCFLAFVVWNMGSNTQAIQTKEQTTSSPTINSVTYACSEGKTIQAVYFNNTVELQLSDKRNFLLMQAISASGVRYTNSDESITFWNKGNTAFMEEGPDSTITYADCVAKATQ